MSRGKLRELRELKRKNSFGVDVCNGFFLLNFLIMILKRLVFTTTTLIKFFMIYNLISAIINNPVSMQKMEFPIKT